LTIQIQISKWIDNPITIQLFFGKRQQILNGQVLLCKTGLTIQIQNPILTLDCQSQSNPPNWIAIRIEQSSNTLHVTRKKLPKRLSYEKFARLILVKLTPGIKGLKLIKKKKIFAGRRLKKKV